MSVMEYDFKISRALHLPPSASSPVVDQHGIVCKVQDGVCQVDVRVGVHPSDCSAQCCQKLFGDSPSRRLTLWGPREIQVVKGDLVVVLPREREILGACIDVYLKTLLYFLVGAGAAWFWARQGGISSPDLAALVGGVLFMVLRVHRLRRKASTPNGLCDLRLPLQS